MDAFVNPTKNKVKSMRKSGKKEARVMKAKVVLSVTRKSSRRPKRTLFDGQVAVDVEAQEAYQASLLRANK